MTAVVWATFGLLLTLNGYIIMDMKKSIQTPESPMQISEVL